MFLKQKVGSYRQLSELQVLPWEECDNDEVSLSFFFFDPPPPPPQPGCVTTFHIYFLSRAAYSDGKIKASPKPHAGNQGTGIRAIFGASSLLSLFCSAVFMLAPPMGMCCIARPCSLFSKCCCCVCSFGFLSSLKTAR